MAPSPPPTSVRRLTGLSQAAIAQVVATAEALEAGRVDEAERKLAAVKRAHPAQAEVLRLHAGIESLRGRHREALAAMLQAVAQRPDDALYQNTLGTVLAESGDFDAAIAALQRCCELQPDLAIAFYNLGVLLTRCVRNDEAISALEKAVALAPGHLDARALLADLLRVRNRPAEAVAEYRRILTERPYAGMAWWGLADMKTLRFDPGDIEHMRAALADPRAGDDDRIATGFALARALDDDGRFAESLAMLEQAHALARRRQQWDPARFVATISAIRAAFESAPSPAPDALGRGVIFIVSLPRSGSTLVEQILASHPRVEGAGELLDLAQVINAESRDRRRPFPLWVHEMTPQDWCRLGQRYLQRTAHWARRRAIFTDKMPSNWYYIGAIRAMLPAARIVAVRRDPVETCFSCYRQFLRGNEYSRTFADLALYWRGFDQCVRDALARHEGAVHECIYEQLVAEPDAQIRRLLDACGLDFDPACLAFHATERDVRSPSAMQVRQPMRSDTARTARYGALLDPLRAALGVSTLLG